MLISQANTGHFLEQMVWIMHVRHFFHKALYLCSYHQLWPSFSYTLSCTLPPGSMVSALVHARYCSCFDCVRSTMECLSGFTRPPSTCWSWWTPTLHGGKDRCRSLREMLPSPIPLNKSVRGYCNQVVLSKYSTYKCNLLLRIASYPGSSPCRISADTALLYVTETTDTTERLFTII